MTMNQTVNDDYIPNFDLKALLKQMLRLPLSVLCDMTLVWASKFGVATNDDVESLSYKLEKLQKKKVRRQEVVSKILLKYWPQGLNLFQIAHIECHLMYRLPHKYLWNSSTLKKPNGEKSLVTMDPEKFIENLQDELSKVYLPYLYVFRYPNLPLMMCRIQLFDTNTSYIINNTDITTLDGSKDFDMSRSISKSLKKPLVTRKAFYLAIPDDATSIIYSADTDTYALMILQIVQKILSERAPIVLQLNNDTPIKSIDQINILHGSSRDAYALGPWKIYTDANFEVSPLSKIETHLSCKGKRALSRTEQSDHSDAKKLKLENNMLRFKGTKITNDTKTSTDIVNEVSEDGSTSSNFANRYRSLVPVTKAHFIVQSSYGQDQTNETVTINFKFTGNDIFGGLHELCDKELIDSSHVPGWMTGENGISSGRVINGKFEREKIGKGGIL